MKYTTFLSVFLPLIILVLLSAKPTYAFTDNFDVSIDPDGLTQVVNPGKSYNLSVDMDTNNITLTVYPVALDLPESGAYGTSNSWITFDTSSLTLNNATSTTLNFTLTIPQDTYNGEYVKAVGVSDIPYSDGESDNPPIVMGIPITVQVSGGKDRPGASSSTSSTSTSTSTTTSITPVSKQKVTPKTAGPGKPKSDLYSEIKLTSFYSLYNPLNQIQTFHLKLKNEGNISSTPEGFINIVNSQNQLTAQLIINKSELPIKPDSEVEYQPNFKSDQFLIGRLKSEAWLGYKNSQTNIEPKLKQTIYFYYMSREPLTLLALTILVIILLTKIPLPKIHFITYYRYISIFLIASLSLGLLIYQYKSAKQQIDKSLGTETQLTVTATVKKIVGVKAVIVNSSIVIKLIGTNKKGIKLFSLQKGARIVLAEASEPTAVLTSYTLNGVQARFPILCLTRGY